MKYKVYYARVMPRDLNGVSFVPGETHAFIRELEVDALGEVYGRMQGLNWSPNGEATPILKAAGVFHTSMSPGDVAVDEEGRAWLCDWLGWTEIEPPKRWLRCSDHP